MTNSGPITREEMIEMFGSEAPIEAINLVCNSPGTKTLGDIRAELRALAAEKKAQAAQVDENYFRVMYDRFASYLAIRYGNGEATNIANWCDKILDPSGRLLGKVREIARSNHALRDSLNAAGQGASNP